MIALTIADYLKYANLQMAAEAFIRDPVSGILSSSGAYLIRALVRGNEHSSTFTTTEAVKFESDWEVVDQRANISTGFSGTLFRNKTTNELVGDQSATEDQAWTFRIPEDICFRMVFGYQPPC